MTPSIDKELHEVGNGLYAYTQLPGSWGWSNAGLRQDERRSRALPNRTFQGELELQVGDKRVVLIEVGAAHTRGDAVVCIPGDKTLFTGDREPAEVLALFAGMARLQRS